jgi:precorrin-6B C5,15-methyltransferase / cobalt-precorrin-6B C5,C15-methyltransferase
MNQQGMNQQGMNRPGMSPEVTVIGCDGRPLAPEATAALAAAQLVIGAPRHLAAAPVPRHAEQIELKHLGNALGEIAAHDGPTVVLASGDPGFFGIVRALRARGITPYVIPAVSSVADAFARIGLDWDDALVVSAHGRDPNRALAAALAHPKAALLTAPGTARDLGKQLLAAGKRVYAVELLGTPDERVTEDPARDLADPNVLIALDPDDAPSEPRWLAGHQGAPDGWALPEDVFAHRDSMITKAEVRALVLARLGPGPGRTIWDVGAGSGSVAVECARFGAYVIAVEADQAQCDRIRQNAERHRVRPRIVHANAPGALAGLPDADAVFVGGGDRAVLDAAIWHANPRTVVVTLAAVERVGETAALLAVGGYRADGVQLQASRLVPLPGRNHRLAAQNPVFVLWGSR